MAPLFETNIIVLMLHIFCSNGVRPHISWKPTSVFILHFFKFYDANMLIFYLMKFPECGHPTFGYLDMLFFSGIAQWRPMTEPRGVSRTKIASEKVHGCQVQVTLMSSPPASTITIRTYFVLQLCRCDSGKRHHAWNKTRTKNIKVRWKRGTLRKNIVIQWIRQ